MWFVIVDSSRLVGQVGITSNQRTVGRPDRVKCPVLARGAQYFQRSQWQFQREASVFDPDAVGDRKRGGGKHAVERRVRSAQRETANIEEKADAEDRQQRDGTQQDVALN